MSVRKALMGARLVDHSPEIRGRIGLGCGTVQGLSITDYTKQGRTQGGELEVEAQQIKRKLQPKTEIR